MKSVVRVVSRHLDVYFWLNRLPVRPLEGLSHVCHQEAGVVPVSLRQQLLFHARKCLFNLAKEGSGMKHLIQRNRVVVNTFGFWYFACVTLFGPEPKVIIQILKKILEFWIFQVLQFSWGFFRLEFSWKYQNDKPARIFCVSKYLLFDHFWCDDNSNPACLL